ncbi:MAG: VCBS repeat-containing protein, partial [Planctomycetaceae bacterium]|nr:VCBS repeat-containing protein [Planctomycetaceae bacterium]
EGGSGYFVDSGQALGFAKSHDAELGDLDGDGDLDIVIGNTFDASEIWFNDGQGNYTNSGQALSASTGVSLGDLDGDGDLDIFLVNGFDGVNYDEVWLNDGSGFFQHSGQTISTVDDCIVKLGDLDGDGDLDAFIGGSTSNGVILLNDGNAHFTDSGQVLLSTLQEYRFGVDLGDLDGDGDLDAFMVSTSGGEVVFLNDGTGVFSEHQALEVAPRAISVNLGDVDSDGDLDAVIADYVDADILLLNDGTGTFTLGQYLPHVPNDKWEADFADIDNDGDLDIFVSGDDARTNFVWLNDGLGHFTDSGQRLTDGGGVGLALGDVDGDNDIDAVVSVYYDAELGNRIWLNQNITLPYSNDFETAGWKGLYAKTPQLFSLVENTGNHSFQVDNSGLTGLGAAVLPLEDPLPGAFEMSAIITSIPGANRWFDGFLIFDYVNDNDFKYAGFFTGQNQWVIGHFQGDFNNRLAQVDWDNEGRTINTNTPYAVHVRIDGEMVYLSVDGEYITEAMFAAPVTGGQIGLAGYNAVTQFDNFIVDEKVSQGSSSLLPYAEDFNDEIANNLAFVGENRWGIYTDSGDKSLIFNGRNNYGLGVAYLDTEFPMPDQYEIVAKVKSNSTANVWYDGFLIFDYQGPNDFKYAGMFVGQNQWVIGHYQGNWNDRIAQFDMDDVGGSINADQEYTLFVTVNGDNVELFVDGLKRVEGTFVGGIAKGSAGVATYNGWTGFDDLEISESVSYGKPVEIPFSEDFEDVVANDFYYNRPNYWKTVSPGDQNLLRVNTSYNNLLAVAHVPLNPVTAPDSFILSADIRSNPVASGWTNGFIIFDYKHDNDFKYAGFFTGQNEWVIGHYQGDWDTRLAEVDWDNEGRSINTKQWYHLEVEIEQDIAKLIVDGEVLAEADFDVPLNQGAVGLAADRAFTWFDNFAIQSFPPPGAPLFSSGDLLFANWDEEQDELLI